MGHDENTNYLAGGANQGTPATPTNSGAPSAPFAPGAPISPATPTQAAPVASTTPGFGMQTLSNNRLGMRPARDLKNVDELNRIVAAETRENIEANGGDIILAPSAPVKNKKKVFVLLLVAAAVILLALVVVLTVVGANGGGMFAKKETTASALTDWLLNGDGSDYLVDENRDNNSKLEDYVKDSKKLIYPLSFYNATSLNTSRNERVEEYFAELDRRYQALKADESMASKKNEIEKLGRALSLLEYNVNYVKKLKEIFAGYDNEGNCRVEGCFTKYFDKDLGDEKYNEILKKQREFYLESVRKMYLYSSAGCYDEKNTGDYDCILSQGNSELTDRIDSQVRDVDDLFGEISNTDLINMLNGEIVATVKKINEV